MINIILKKNYIRDFKKKDINKKFLESLNNQNLNKFLSTRKKKQTLRQAIKYLKYMRQQKYFYLGVFDKFNNELIGTITYRQISKESYALGFMIANIKFLGKKNFFYAVKSSMNYFFQKYNINIIQAATNKTNIQSTFFLIKLGFKLIGKSHYSFDFVKYKKK